MLTTLRSGTSDRAAPPSDTYLADVAARLARQTEHEREGFLHRLTPQAPEMAAQLRALLAGIDTSHGPRDLRPGDTIVRLPSRATPSRSSSSGRDERSPLRGRRPLALSSLFAERQATMRHARPVGGPASPHLIPPGPPASESAAAALASRRAVIERARAARAAALRTIGSPSPWEGKP